MAKFNDDQYYQYPPYGFAPRPFSHGALGTQHQDTFVFSNVGKGPKGEKGEKGDTGDPLTFDDLSAEDINKLVEMLSYVGVGYEDAIVITSGSSTSVIPIPIETYDEFGLLFIDINGLDLAYGVDYTIEDDSIVLTQPLPSDQRVHFRALRYQIADAKKLITKIVAANAFAFVDDAIGTPYVDVDADVESNLYFYFHNLKGEQGEQGEDGQPLLFEDLTQEELDSIYENVSFVGTGEKTGSYTTTEPGETVIPIDVDGYSPDDILFVVIDGKTLIEGVDYVMGPEAGEITLTNPVEEGTKVYFRALGYNLPDGDKNIVINYNSEEQHIDFPIPVNKGGTNATTPADARVNLGSLASIWLNGYYGIGYPNGNANGYIRTTQNGLLPYQSDPTNGYGSLGVASWPFANAYVKKINGKSADATAAYTVTKSEKLSTNSADKINANATFVKEIKFTPNAGYKPVGIINIHKSGTNAGFLTLNSFNMDGLGAGTESTLRVTFRNVGSSAVTASAVTLQIQVACVKVQ